MFSPVYERQLQYNGIKSLYSDAFLEDNVYFVSNGGEDKELLLAYMTEEFGELNCVKVKDMGNYGIYKFSCLGDERSTGESDK